MPNEKYKFFRKNENNFYKDIETADKKTQRFSNITSKVITFLDSVSDSTEHN